MAGAEALLMFGDSSGNPARTIGGFADSRYYVVGTIAVGAREAHRLDEQVLEIKKRHLPDSDPLRAEFHGSALRKRLNRYTGNRVRAEKMFLGILDDLVDIIVGSSASVNMVIMDKGVPVETSGHMGIMSRSWAYAADMFRQSILHSKPDTTGIAILDRYDDAENRIVGRAVAQSPGRLGPLAQDMGSRAVPYPIFVDSRSSNMIQLVDTATYVVARHTVNGEDAEFARMHRRLLPGISRTIRAIPWPE